MGEPNKRNGILRNLRIKRVDLVDMGANFDRRTGDGAHIMLFKSAPTPTVPAPVIKDGPSLSSVHSDSPDWDHTDQDEYEKGTLTAESRRGLPDSAFAAVWTDAQGKKHRKLPIHDAGHLAAARGRVDGADIPASVKAAARSKIEHATNAHSDTNIHKEKPVAKTIKEVMKSMLAAFTETDEAKKTELMKAVEEGIESVAMAAPPIPPAAVPPGPITHSPEHLDAMKAHHDALGKMITAYGPGPHPDGHPVHEMKSMHAHLGSVLKDAGVECGTDEPGMLNKGVQMDAEIAKRMDDLAKSNTELTKSLEVEKNLRLDREVVDILKSFKATPFKMEGEDSDVPRFRKMREMDPAGFDRTIALMRATDAQLAESALFKNVGTGRSGGRGTAWSEIEAKADGIVTKSANGITKAQAIDRVLTDPENMSLIKRYREEAQ